jgi:hypothetical protein
MVDLLYVFMCNLSSGSSFNWADRLCPRINVHWPKGAQFLGRGPRMLRHFSGNKLVKEGLSGSLKGKKRTKREVDTLGQRNLFL